MTIPNILHYFIDYYHQNPGWGALHIVLADGNIEDKFVLFVIDEAKKLGDDQGRRLGQILLKLTKTQRKLLPHKVIEAINLQRGESCAEA